MKKILNAYATFILYSLFLVGDAPSVRSAESISISKVCVCALTNL